MLCCKPETAIYPTAITVRCLEITREIWNILCEPLMYNIVLQEIWFTDFPLPVVLNFARFSHNNPKLWHTDDYMHVIMYGIQSNPCKNSNCSGLEGFYRWGSVSFPLHGIFWLVVSNTTMLSHSDICPSAFFLLRLPINASNLNVISCNIVSLELATKVCQSLLLVNTFMYCL